MHPLPCADGQYAAGLLLLGMGIRGPQAHRGSDHDTPQPPTLTPPPAGSSSPQRRGTTKCSVAEQWVAPLAGLRQANGVGAGLPPGWSPPFPTAPGGPRASNGKRPPLPAARPTRDRVALGLIQLAEGRAARQLVAGQLRHSPHTSFGFSKAVWAASSQQDIYVRHAVIGNAVVAGRANTDDLGGAQVRCRATAGG